MTAEQLRNSILQEAISGRLVPQDPNDEPAAILLQRIREEKARLVKEGKLKKKDLVETPIAEDEIPFEIPSCWEWVRLGGLCNRFSTGPFGTMLHKEDYVSTDGHPLINPTNIKSGKIVSNGIKRTSDKKYHELSSYILRKNDIVLARRGDLSKSAIVTSNEEGWLAGTGAFFMHLYDGVYFLPFFIYIYTSTYCQAYLLSESVGGTMDNLNQNLLSKMLIPLPPLAEQKRIVAKLEELLPIVEQYGKAQTELDELNAALPARLRQSILQEAISGKLVPQDENDEPVDILFNHIQEEKLKLIKQNIIRKKEAVINAVKEDEIPFDIPSSWKWCHLEELVAILDGYRKPVSKHDREVGTYPYYGANGVLDYVRDYIFDGEYLLVGEDGSVITSYGNPIVNKASGKIWVNNHAHVLQECGKLGYYDYLFYALQAISIKKYIHGFMPKYSQGDLRKTMIPLPPLAEQKRIVAKIEELFAEIDKMN